MNPRPAPVRRALAGVAALLLAGCASVAVPPAPAVAPPPPSPPAPWQPEAAAPGGGGSGLGGAAVSLPPPLERMRLLAMQEWRLWGRGRWHAQSGVAERRSDEPRALESDPAFGTRVLHYWLSFKGRDFTPEKIRFPDGSVLPWSAAFISWLAVSAGVPERQFEAHELHWGYIRAALDAGKRPGFEALDAAEAQPAAGDIICAPRDTAADAPAGFAAWRNLPRAQRGKRWAWHCDLVVEVGASEAGAIGGNVLESVTWTRAPLTAGGLLQGTVERPWTVLLRLVAP